MGIVTIVQFAPEAKKKKTNSKVMYTCTSVYLRLYIRKAIATG